MSGSAEFIHGCIELSQVPFFERPNLGPLARRSCFEKDY